MGVFLGADRGSGVSCVRACVFQSPESQVEYGKGHGSSGPLGLYELFVISDEYASWAAAACCPGANKAFCVWVQLVYAASFGIVVDSRTASHPGVLSANLRAFFFISHSDT